MWSHEGSNIHPIGQKWLNGAKNEVLHGTPKKFQCETKVFLGSRRHNWAETIEKLKKSYQVWSHEGSTFKKNGPHFGQNSRPGESDPYAGFLAPPSGALVLSQFQDPAGRPVTHLGLIVLICSKV